MEAEDFNYYKSKHPFCLFEREFSLNNPTKILQDNGYLLTYKDIEYLEWSLNHLKTFYKSQNINNDGKITEINHYIMDTNLENFENYTTKKDKIKGNIYLFFSGETNKYKIGVSKNIKRRFSDLQRHHSKLQIIHIHYDVPDYFKLERKMHERFQSERLHGEWFNLSEQDIILFKNWFI